MSIVDSVLAGFLRIVLFGDVTLETFDGLCSGFSTECTKAVSKQELAVVGVVAAVVVFILPLHELPSWYFRLRPSSPC